MRRVARLIWIGLSLGILAFGLQFFMHLVRAAEGPKGHQGHNVQKSNKQKGKAPLRIPMKHAMHDLEEGAPRGWRFTLPSGDPQEGRRVFVELECYKCHTVRGERFPATESEPGGLGPDLTGMGIHAAEYLAESVINPNAVIVEDRGFTGEDGLSTMPSYNDTITMTQLIDLVAYLRTLTEVGEREGEHHH